MERIEEPELMDDPAQVLAYAQADFEQPHAHFMQLFQECFPQAAESTSPDNTVYALDLGCGHADISRRYARTYPDHIVHAVDGAPNMIKMAQQLNRENGLEANILLQTGYINDMTLARTHYDVIFSNSLLHHLHQPVELWQLIKRASRPGTQVFIMDLLRPVDIVTARRLLDLYAMEESELLRQDFYRSLCAAFSLDEVRQQCLDSNIDFCQFRQVSDRHLIAYGTVR